jgi:hypothetical protein
MSSLCCWHEPAAIKLLLASSFIKFYRYRTKAPETEDQGDANHGVVATYRPCKAASNGRTRRCRAYTKDMLNGWGIGLIYKVTYIA